MAGRHHDVVVIGAGLAGLRCATDLVASGRDVVVLEARDRVGGRVLSHRFANGQWCERGAEFVCGAHTEVLALVDRFGLAIVDVVAGGDDAARLLDMGGRPTPFSLHHSLQPDLERWRSLLEGLAAALDPHDPVASAAAAGLDALPLSALIDDAALSLVARVVVGRDVRTEYMLGPDEVSQLMAAWITVLHHRSGDGLEAHRIVGGNDQLATHLAAPLADRIRLGAAVSIVSPDDGEIVLRSGERLTADHVVAAVPLPVLSRMWSDMPAALGRVSYGIGGKVSVQVRRRIWRDAGRDGGVHTERSWGELWETTDGQEGDAGVLTALLSSHDGASMVSLPECADRIVAEMDRIYPGLAGLAGERVQTDWTNDGHSLGAYACFGPGQLLEAWPAMRRPYGRMLLAGEHTDEWMGYMEGALRSGARVAAAICGAAV
ncbi:MAG: NAD(P)/FAD-dependent oxidoreductase [Ilumatobacteraceae bacterium]